MKELSLLILIVIRLSVISSTEGALTNPEFENATLVPIFDPDPKAVTVADALPGWAAISGSSPLPYLFYNTIALDSPWVSIHDNSDLNVENRPIDGNFSILIQGGNVPGGSALIVQPTIVPAGIHSILFAGRNIMGLELSFGGHPLAYSEIPTEMGFTFYGADITPFVGQSGDLQFRALFQASGLIDDVMFSPQVVPEPSTIALLAASVSLFFFRRKKLICRP